MKTIKFDEKQKQTLKRVLSYISQYKVWVILSLILAVITVAATLYAPVLLGRGVDLIVGKGNVDFPGLFAILKKIGIIVCITAISQWLMNPIRSPSENWSISAMTLLKISPWR